MGIYRGIEVSEKDNGEIMVRVAGPYVKFFDGPKTRWRLSNWWLFHSDGTPLPNFDNPYAEWAWGLYENNFITILNEVDEVATRARLEGDPVEQMRQRIRDLEAEVARLKRRRK